MNRARQIVSPPNRVMFFMGGCIGLWLLISSPDFEQLIETSKVVLTGGFLLYLLYYLDCGHGLMWDEERIIMRYDGLWRWLRPRPLTSIRIADITHVRVEMGQMGARQSRHIAFDHIAVEGPTEGPEPYVMIMPNYINTEDAREALRFINARRPGIMDEKVVAFMNSEKKW